MVCTGSDRVEVVVTKWPPVVAQFRPPGRGEPWQPVAAARTVTLVTATVGVPEKLAVALAPGARSPIEQLKALPPRAQRSGFPPGPRMPATGMPAGSEAPRSTPLIGPFVVFVVLMVKLRGFPTTAGPFEIWVSCKAPGVTILSANAGMAAVTAVPKRLSTRARCPTRLRSLRGPRCGLRGTVMELAVAPVKFVVEHGLKQGAPAALEAR